jgi:hypothetical protein
MERVLRLREVPFLHIAGIIARANALLPDMTECRGEAGVTNRAPKDARSIRADSDWGVSGDGLLAL